MSYNIKGKEFVDITDTNIICLPLLVPACFKLELDPLAPMVIAKWILRTSSRNMKNKVEAQPRKVNKKNSVVEPIRDVDVKQSLLNVNSKPICATCKKSMFDGVHDMCLLDFVENVIQIVLWYLDSRCSKHITGNRSQLMNFASKSLGTVRFGNDHIARIWGMVTINWEM
ncbi:hypothetical protein Tco_1125853 [Tanacetum coccineum]